jgi:hypothetical protein
MLLPSMARDEANEEQTAARESDREADGAAGARGWLPRRVRSRLRDFFACFDDLVSAGRE